MKTRFVPRTATDSEVLEAVCACVDLLASGDYEQAAEELGYALACGRPGAACIRGEIEGYRCPEYFPGITQFRVTDWRSAQGGNPAPTQEVTRYKLNNTGLAAAVAFDLPLNGRWSDLTADFVLTESNDPSGYALTLEEIGVRLR